MLFREPQQLVRDLPDNCRASPGASIGIPQVRNAADPEGWEVVNREDALSILSDLDRRIKPVLDPSQLGHRRVKPVLDPTQLGRWSRQRLAFYGLDLLKIEPKNSDETWIAYVLWKPGFALPLDSTSSPIHDLNAMLGANRRSQSGDGAVIRTREEAAAYTVFFCRHVWAEEGPFIVLKSKDDSAVRQLDLTEATFNPDRFDSKEDALAAIAEPVPTEVKSSGNPLAFEVVACVLYGQTIFKATFAVLADGSITMTDDEPMVEPIAVRADGAIDVPDDEPTTYPLHHLPLECVIREPAELEPLTASKLVLEEESGQSTIADRVLIGQLTQETLHVRVFRRCRFRGQVNLQHLVSDHGLSFEQCVFENGLDLSGASLKGTLSLTQCLIAGRHDAHGATARPSWFSLNHLSADSLQIDGLWSTGSLSAAGVRIPGAVELSEVMTQGEIDLTGLAAQSLLLSDTYAREDIQLKGCVIEQFMDFQDVQTGSSIRLYGAVVKYNYVWFQDVTLTGDLSAPFLRVGTVFALESDTPRGNTIGGSLELGGANLPAQLRVSNSHVGESIKAKAVTTGEVRVFGGRLKPIGPEVAVGPDIGGIIDLTDAEIEHDVTLVDLTVGKDPGEDTDSNASLRLRNAKVGGSVRLFLTAEDAKAQKWPEAAEENLVGEWQHGLDLQNATIRGDVELSGVHCPKGGIKLQEAEIQRDLHINQSRPSRRATATHLAMTGLKCLGAADITGLELRAHPEPAAESRNGAVIANLATFAKGLKVAKSAERLGGGATIPGRLDLTGSTIGDLAVSYSSFPCKNDDTNLKAHGIILNQARVDKLSVFRTRSDNKDECRYPQPIDLSFSEIKWWEFRNDTDAKGGNPKDAKSDDPGVSEEVKDYELLLDGDTHKQRHTFSSIERNLFNRGLDDAADDIHVKMRWWLRRQGNDTFFGWWKNRGRSLWDLATRATTSPWRLIWAVVIPWTVISALVVFSNPANIAPSENGLIANREWRADRVPLGAEWDRWAGVWMAVRFHVPVAVFTARESWAPANSRELTVSLPGGTKWSLTWISPEDYANFVLALHCLIWPVILVIASRKFFMRLGK